MEKLKGCMVSYILLTLFCVAGALFLPQGAEAALFRVNSTDDIVDD
jgi:hypothetical protein